MLGGRLAPGFGFAGRRSDLWRRVETSAARGASRGDGGVGVVRRVRLPFSEFGGRLLSAAVGRVFRRVVMRDLPASSKRLLVMLVAAVLLAVFAEPLGRLAFSSRDAGLVLVEPANPSQVAGGVLRTGAAFEFSLTNLGESQRSYRWEAFADAVRVADGELVVLAGDTEFVLVDTTLVRTGSVFVVRVEGVASELRYNVITL